MLDNPLQPAPETPPEPFVTQVKEALEYLHDLGALQSNPLVLNEALVGNASTGVAVQRLRAALVNAIETLNPGKSTPFGAPHARIYHLLTLHYVDKLTIRETAHELGISPRQADRGLRQGEQSVAAVLRDQLALAKQRELDATQASSLKAEMDLLPARLQPTDLCALISQCQKSSRPLAVQRDLRLVTEIPPQPLIISTDPLLAEQVFLAALGRAMGQAQPGNLWLTLRFDGHDATLELTYCVEPEADRAVVIDSAVAEMVARLHWTAAQTDRTDGRRVITIATAAPSPIVLVIDDNEALVTLLQRHLTREACRMVGATHGQEGLRLAKELRPAAIILDVMMPDMHGWDVLQRLRASKETAATPVIVCSVINNPDLAQALGAALFLTKPVRHEDILAALTQLKVI